MKFALTDNKIFEEDYSGSLYNNLTLIYMFSCASWCKFQIILGSCHIRLRNKATNLCLHTQQICIWYKHYQNLLGGTCLRWWNRNYCAITLTLFITYLEKRYYFCYDIDTHSIFVFLMAIKEIMGMSMSEYTSYIIL